MSYFTLLLKLYPVCRIGTIGSDIDALHLPIVTEVSMALQTEESDILVDSERKSETRSFQLEFCWWCDTTKIKCVKHYFNE